jgi:hypothetical protein
LLSKNIKLKIYINMNLPVVLNGCETVPFVLREKHRLRVLRMILGSKKEAVQNSRKLHNDEAHDYIPAYIHTYIHTHGALKTIYKGAIVPLLLHRAPVWIDAMKYEHNKRKSIRVQRLINIRSAKAFRTTSSEALCLLTGITPIIIKTEEAVKQYSVRKGKGSQTQELDTVVDLKEWPHPADCVTITEAKDYYDTTVQAYTDGSKCEQGLGSGAAIFIGKKAVAQIKLRLDSRCSNNQAEQLAIIKALEAIESTDTTENSPRTATIFTDSRITFTHYRTLTTTSTPSRRLGKE